MSGFDFSPTVPVIDANICVGHPRDAWSSAAKKEDVLAELNRHGVQRAVVYHAQAENVSPITGQEMLSEWVADDPRFIPQVCVLPNDDSLELLNQFKNQPALRSARLSLVLGQTLLFTPSFYGPLLRWLQENDVPLFIPIHAVDLRDVATTLAQYPELRSVLVGAHYTHYLWINPLMRALPNLYLELSRYEVFAQIEALAAEFGAERLLYGSGYPGYAMGPMLFYLHKCRLRREQLELICGGNIQRLLNLER